MDYVVLVVNALAEDRGIVPSTLPGYMPPPPPRRSVSPSIQSMSSPGIHVSSLGLSETPSNQSSRSSSKADHPGKSSHRVT